MGTTFSKLDPSTPYSLMENKEFGLLPPHSKNWVIDHVQIGGMQQGQRWRRSTRLLVNEVGGFDAATLSAFIGLL